MTMTMEKLVAFLNQRTVFIRAVKFTAAMPGITVTRVGIEKQPQTLLVKRFIKSVYNVRIDSVF